VEVDTDADDLFAEDEDDENASEKEDRCEKSILKGQERSEGEGSLTKSVPDMYKAFDGSGLMAIGTPHLQRITLRAKLNDVTQVCYSKSMYQCF
jgi:5-hydroxyisourate hydrolase-like protein (transthyretin family)